MEENHRPLHPVAAHQEQEDIGSNRSTERRMTEIVTTRLSRRDVLRGLLAGAALMIPGAAEAVNWRRGKHHHKDWDDWRHWDRRHGHGRNPSTLDFKELAHSITEDHQVAQGYEANVLLRWGDPVLPGAPAWDANALSAAAQKLQFGYNCDFLGYFPLHHRANSSRHGILCVNHEYTNSELMWAGGPASTDLTQDEVDVEMAAHGMSFVEIIRRWRGDWTVVENSPFNRRINALDTECEITGPAAGHPRLRTGADPTGTICIGSLNNCAGGKTPWGTVLTAEENFNGYFTGFDYATQTSPEKENLRRYGFSSGGFGYGWSQYYDRL